MAGKVEVSPSEPRGRLKQHLTGDPSGTPRQREWMRGLREKGLAPELVVLETVRYEEVWRQPGHASMWQASERPVDVEQRWVARALDVNPHSC